MGCSDSGGHATGSGDTQRQTEEKPPYTQPETVVSIPYSVCMYVSVCVLMCLIDQLCVVCAWVHIH